MTLLSQSGEHLYAIADRNLRPDLASYFKHDNFAHAAFQANLDLSGLSGRYKIGLGYLEGDVYKLCPQFSYDLIVSNSN